MTNSVEVIGTGAPQGTELLLVRQGHEYFALELLAAIEALELPVLTALPDAHHSLLGMTTVRGEVIPVFESGTVLEAGCTKASDRMLVVVSDGDRRIGLVVDEIEDVIMEDLAAVQRPMDTMRADSIVRGVIHSAHRLVAVLDARALVRLAVHVAPERA